ncbi:ty3-gypsy retrotransposon protein [Cucumis melo var. makuwa]|uniref:Ty3-gypsy retrotransposon protein n=1 Tax=Cucumis melo var. makuwa TaxID=1194695 RepID=A0A5A7SJ31_CUCMM|nr:ty3-gypsy retrotransposon protein [Cucumis melo var. makuwa]
MIQPDISVINDQMELVVEPDHVSQLCWNDAERDWEYLVHWKDQSSHEATWESYATLVNQFPDFHLGDKVALLHGGIARPPVMQVYHRKRKKDITAPMSEIKEYKEDDKIFNPAPPALSSAGETDWKMKTAVSTPTNAVTAKATLGREDITPRNSSSLDKINKWEVQAASTINDQPRIIRLTSISG